MSFSKIFQILFIVGSTFPIFISECLDNSWWCFSSSFSTFEDRRRISLKSCSILFKIHGSSLMLSSHNYFRFNQSAFSSFLPIVLVIHSFAPSKVLAMFLVPLAERSVLDFVHLRRVFS